MSTRATMTRERPFICEKEAGFQPSSRCLASTLLQPAEGCACANLTACRACSEGNLDLVKVLVDDLGADHSPQDRWGGTPLNDAYRHRHEPVISYLKQQGARLGTQATADDDPATELCEAAAKADVARLHWLVREKGYDVNTSDYDKRTAIHLGEWHNDSNSLTALALHEPYLQGLEAVSLLLATLLLAACSEGNLAVVKTLIDELGADHSPLDRWGGTPLNDAIRQRHEPVILHLNKLGAKLGNVSTVNGDPATELCNAAAKADVKELSFLVRMKKFDVNVGDYDHRTAIHLACSEGNLLIVKTLIEELGANHSPSDRWGGTPLNDAIRQGHTHVVEYLKQQGAGLGKATTNEDDPATELCKAAAKADTDRLCWLVREKGYNVNTSDYDKRTAIHLGEYRNGSNPVFAY